MSEPREMLAGLHLLDRQIVDRDGWLAGKVDDLELDVGDDAAGAPPVVTAILSGAGALARQLDGRLGRWVEAIDERLTKEVTPSRIGFQLVTEIASHVKVSVTRDELETSRAEHWVRKHVIEHIPGAGHAPE